MSQVYSVGSLFKTVSIPATTHRSNAPAVTGFTVGNLYMATVVGNYKSNVNPPSNPAYSTGFGLGLFGYRGNWTPVEPGWGVAWNVGSRREYFYPYPPYVPFVRRSADSYHAEVFIKPAYSTLWAIEGDGLPPYPENWVDDNAGNCVIQFYNASVVESTEHTHFVWWD